MLNQPFAKFYGFKTVYADLDQILFKFIKIAVISCYIARGPHLQVLFLTWVMSQKLQTVKEKIQ